MTDDTFEPDAEGRLSADEIAPSRDPDAAFGLPDVDQDGGDDPLAAPGASAGVKPFIDASNQNPGIAARAAGPWSADEEAPKGQDTSSEDAFTERALAPRPGPDENLTSETDP